MPESIDAHANAKVNFGLIVGSRDQSGYHSIISLVQSISWSDELSLSASDADDFQVEGMEPDEHNLAWRAVEAVREDAGGGGPIKLLLKKRLPIAAGLGGGSADAAAGLGMAAEFFGIDDAILPTFAVQLGSDVAFCLQGGLALMEGRGERITPQNRPPPDYVLAIVVPPLELATADVYARWDELDGPEGVAVSAPALPPSLRSYDPLRNDLDAAAVSLTSAIGDWRGELMSAWGRPVLMTGSGPALYGFFLDVDEATAALDAAPSGSRAASVAEPVARGWEMSSGTLADPN